MLYYCYPLTQGGSMRLGHTDNIDAYMKDIEQYPRLTREQELELHKLMHGSDSEAAAAAREKLIVCNLRLVVKIAHDYKAYGELSELIQEGSKGLMIAADKFDPSRSPKFSLVASFWLKQTIRRYLTSNNRTVRIPGGMAQLAAKVAKTRNAFEAAHGRKPTDEELAEATGISLTRLDGARTADISLVSTNEKLDADSEVTFEEMLSEEDDSEQKRMAAKGSAIEHILSSMDNLADMDRFLIKSTYGIGCAPVAMDVLTTETGWCKQRIHGRLCQIYAKIREHVGDQVLEY